MIVDCPSCGTAYRHREMRVEEPCNARCSRCATVFPLEARRHRYRVVGGPHVGSSTLSGTFARFEVPSAVSGRPAPTRMAIGMDDPSLASRLERTALDQEAGEVGSVLTYRVDVDSIAETETSGDGDRNRDAAVSVGRRAKKVRPFFKILFGLASGLAVAWALLFRLRIDPLQAALAGTAVALLVSWVGLRWKSTSR